MFDVLIARQSIEIILVASPVSVVGPTLRSFWQTFSVSAGGMVLAWFRGLLLSRSPIHAANVLIIRASCTPSFTQEWIV